MSGMDTFFNPSNDYPLARLLCLVKQDVHGFDQPGLQDHQ